MTRKPTILALVEHVDRELDLLCLLRAELRARFGLDMQIMNFYADAPLALNGPAPDLLLTPFFYATEDVVLADYVKAWPETTWLNFAWEQVFYPSQAMIKRPRDAFTRNTVSHIAWSHEFVRYQVENGVRPENVHLVGHGVYGLYQPSRRSYFSSRETLAARHGLDQKKRWVFVPENYRWAFFTDKKLKNLGARGVDADDLFAMRAYCRASMADLIKWCEVLTDTGEAEVIFRPRPATSVDEFITFMKGVIGERAPRFHLIKQESAREWVFASDVVVSSFSTVLIEAALAGKPVMRAEPRVTPKALRYDWCELVAEATTQTDFVRGVLSVTPASTAALRGWAASFFFPSGDPVENLVQLISAAAQAVATKPAARAAETMVMALRPDQVEQARAMAPDARDVFFRDHAKGYFFNRDTHEKDMFSTADVEAREARWREVLPRSASADAASQS
jgi:surface carbohydrate biosynthesis protein